MGHDSLGTSAGAHPASDCGFYWEGWQWYHDADRSAHLQNTSLLGLGALCHELGAASPLDEQSDGKGSSVQCLWVWTHSTFCPLEKRKVPEGHTLLRAMSQEQFKQNWSNSNTALSTAKAGRGPSLPVSTPCKAGGSGHGCGGNWD